MTRLREVALVYLVVILAIVCILAVYEIFFPPYTDAQIQASFVDTWEVHALGTAAILLLVLMAAVVAPALAWGCSRLGKKLAVVSVALAGTSAALLITSHAALTERTTALTGQSFGGFYGLF